MAWQAESGRATLDNQALLVMMWEFCNDAFRNTLDYAERSPVSELREIGNR